MLSETHQVLQTHLATFKSDFGEASSTVVSIKCDGSASFDGAITTAPTTDESGDSVATTKAYVLSKIGAAGGGTVTSVSSGNGLTGGPITGAGTLSVLADGSTINVGSSGISVNTGALPFTDNTGTVTSVATGNGTDRWYNYYHWHSFGSC